VAYLAIIIIMALIDIVMAALAGAISEYDKMIITNIISSVCSLILAPLMVLFGIILFNSLKATKQIVPAEPTQPATPIQ
jgi:uncharacterized membrane protein